MKAKFLIIWMAGTLLSLSQLSNAQESFTVPASGTPVVLVADSSLGNGLVTPEKSVSKTTIQVSEPADADLLHAKMTLRLFEFLEEIKLQPDTDFPVEICEGSCATDQPSFIN